ncbi:hypothetical protein Tco_0765585 [Tanacetum coccineum]
MVKIHTDKNVTDLLTKAFDVILLFMSLKVSAVKYNCSAVILILLSFYLVYVILLGKAKKSVKLMMEKLFRMELELMLSTGVVKTINREVQLHALVDGKKVIITKVTIRRDLKLEDEEGVDCLPNSTIFEQLTLIGSKTTSWNEFSSTIASAIICLATNQKFVQVFLNQQLDEVSTHNKIYIASSHTKKIFGNMKRVGKGFSGRVTPLFPTIVVPQPSGPTEHVADEAVHKELGDSLVRDATTPSSLDAEQDSGNITKTRSKATPNESSSLGTTSGGGPRRQETMGDTIAQTRFENVSKLSNDSLITRGNTLRSDEDRLKLKELMELSRVESFGNEEDLGEDTSKQGRRINAIDADEDITLVRQNENVVEEIVDAAQVSTAATTVTITTKEVTLAQALADLKSIKPKAKGIILQELGESTTTTTISSKGLSQDKGKGVLVEPEKPLKKQDQFKLDEEMTLKLQAEIDEEERIARAEEEKIDEANIAWDDIQEKVDADYQLAERLQDEEQEQFIIEEKATLFKELLQQRRKHFTAKRAEEKRNKPPTKLNRRRS